MALNYKSEEEKYLQELKKTYSEIKGDIEERISEYKNIWDTGKNREIHIELSFCILTPQSKARSAWGAIEKLVETNTLFTGDEKDIVEYLNVVRFKNNKATNLVLLRELMKDEDGNLVTKTLVDKIGNIKEKREWLVKNIRGIAYKEASHFLRNVGFGDELAILDRHVLKNLVRLGVIKEIPKTITPKRYFEIENKMIKFTKKSEIPMDHFDLLLWYLEAGEVFK